MISIVVYNGIDRFYHLRRIGTLEDVSSIDHSRCSRFDKFLCSLQDRPGIDSSTSTRKQWDITDSFDDFVIVIR
jgi:hypothetical protein